MGFVANCPRCFEVDHNNLLLGLLNCKLLVQQMQRRACNNPKLPAFLAYLVIRVLDSLALVYDQGIYLDVALLMEQLWLSQLTQRCFVAYRRLVLGELAGSLSGSPFDA